MTDPVLISRYPGAKSDRAKYPVGDGKVYDVGIVPFAGSGRWCVPALQHGHIKSLIVADADPAVRAVWGQFRDQTHQNWSFLGFQIDAWVEELVLADDPGSVFEKLVEIVNLGLAGESQDLAELAAAKILLHKLCFGGNVRSNSQGKLNITLRTDWEKALLNYHYELPWCPPNRSVKIMADWSECWTNVPKDAQTIAFVDPPYYAPGNSPRVKGGMSQAYSAHGGHPSDRSVLDLFVGAIGAAIEAGCDRIVATNYWGHRLETIEYDGYGAGTVLDRQWISYETADFMQAMGFDWFRDLGPLQGMNNRDFNIEKANTTEQRTIRHEGWWEKGGIRQHGRVVQPDLFQLGE